MNTIGALLALLSLVALSTSQTIPVNITRKFASISFNQPVDFQHDAASNTFYVVERRGVILAIDANNDTYATTFLDIIDRVESGGGEQGLLGLALHPNFAQNRRFFVYYTNPDTVISRFTANTPVSADANSEFVLLTFDQPYENHNGGGIIFGSDGYLYIGSGDGGSGGDPQNFAQNTNSFLGKYLRINVDATSAGKNYTVPSDNPFVGTNGFLPEIWAYGLRNPWRWSFDRVTGRLWAGDVGQGAWEEISIVPRGGNMGWRVMEGNYCYNPANNCDRSGKVLAVYNYPRSEGQSVTGGFVYRSLRVPQLYGMYLFADYGSSRLWAMNYNESNPYNNTVTRLQYSGRVSSFGQDAQNNVYILEYGQSRIYMIDQVTGLTFDTSTFATLSSSATPSSASNGSTDSTDGTSSEEGAASHVFISMILSLAIFCFV